MSGDPTRTASGRAGVATRGSETLGAALDSRRDAVLLALVGAQAVAFAVAAASGNIPDAVLVLFRALLTL